VLDQYELGNQLWLQLSPLYTDSTLIKSHDLSLERRRESPRPSLERNLYGHVQQRPAG
jgi:hypothetical protein